MINNENLMETDENKRDVIIYKLGEYTYQYKGLKVSDFRDRLKSHIDEGKIPEELGLDPEFYKLLIDVENKKNRLSRSFADTRLRQKIIIYIYYESLSEEFLFFNKEIGKIINRDRFFFKKHKEAVLPPPYSKEEWKTRIFKELNNDKLISSLENEWEMSGEIYDIPEIKECIFSRIENDTGVVYSLDDEKSQDIQVKFAKIWEVYKSQVGEDIKKYISVLDRKYKNEADSMENNYRLYYGHEVDEFLDTDGLRKCLYEALDNTKERLWISCPWLCRYEGENKMVKESFLYFKAFYEEEFNRKKQRVYYGSTIGERILYLVRHGKRVIIQFGYERTGMDFDSLSALETLWIPDMKMSELGYYIGKNLRIYHQLGNHQKMILKDHDLLVTGSCNFLSNKGGFTNDMGYRTSNRQIVDNEWKRVNAELKNLTEITDLESLNSLRERLGRLTY